LKAIFNSPILVKYDRHLARVEDAMHATRAAVDPAKVPRSALQNAASIAALMLTTEALISEIPDAGKAAAMPGGGEATY
jgi:hypothetical protein